MYAKLFSRITESSLMEEEIPVRYTFVMLLAISDLKGYVIGTDVAIARRLNMPTKDFLLCITALMEPDADSNSKTEDGRRIIHSDCERGYKIVNYETYRDVRDEEQRREYMREYMRDYRKRPVNSVNSSEPELANAEASAKAEVYPSERAVAFAEWFKTIIPDSSRISDSIIKSWEKCYDDLLRLDRRTPEEIAKVCKWARADDFWCRNFLSPLKLRKKNRDGTSYFDVLSNQMKHSKNGNIKTHTQSPVNAGTSNAGRANQY